MNFTKVHNPTDSEVALQFRGETYSIGAGKTSEFPVEVANQWVTIYGFMTLVGESTEPKVESEESIIKPKVTKKK